MAPGLSSGAIVIFLCSSSRYRKGVVSNSHILWYNKRKETGGDDMDTRTRDEKREINLANENEEVETIIEEMEEAKGSVYRQAMNEKAIVSFTLGILSIVFIWLFLYASPVMGVVGIFFGVQGRKEGKKTVYGGNGMATAGLVCSLVGLVVSLVKIFVWIFA